MLCQLPVTMLVLMLLILLMERVLTVTLASRLDPQLCVLSLRENSSEKK